MCLEFVRSGNKVVQLLISDYKYAKIFLCRTDSEVMTELLNHFNELRNEKATILLLLSCVALPRYARKESSYLVDPASSHMLVSKIKPCMSKYKQICTVKLRMAH